MGGIERKQKEGAHLSKRLITTGIAAVFIFLVLIVLLIITDMEDLNLTLKGNSWNIDPFAIKIGFIVLETLMAVLTIILLMRVSAERNEAEERMRIMFDTTPLCANFWDKNFNNIDCNQEAVKLFGLSGKKEYNDRFFELSPEYQPDGSLSRDKAIELIKKAFEEGYLRFEWMHQKLNGEPIPCEVTLVRVKHNNEFALAAYLRDLRELKASIEQTNESEQSLSILLNILNGLDAMVFVTVPDTGEILFVNDQMKKEFNIKDEGIGLLCYEVFQDGMNGICDFCPCFRLHEEPDRIITWEKRNDKTKRIYRHADRYIEWQNGRIVHIQYSVDVTELIEAKENAEQSSRYKSQFLSLMSHEVRTPMNAILGITEIQLQDEAMSPSMREAMDKIFNSGYLLLGIINDILDLSKIEAGKLELSPASYDVPSLINDTVNLNIMQYENKPINFNLYVDENIPSTLFGDELRIKQILNNLLSNAFKYTDKGKVLLSITAEYTQQGEEPQVTLIICVADTGQGMTGEQLDKLFDEYTRFNTEANRTTTGTGLGMSITRQLVNMMGGDISVESEPGKGSMFTVRLPQGIVGPRVLGRELAENIRQLNAGGVAHINNVPQIVREYMPYGKVLIVDDVETNLYVARGLMAPYGLSIETATSGFEAIEKIKGGSTFDIIFLDHFMPRMDGIETVKIIRSLGYKNPIIALSANALAGQAETFMENGFDGFISKPIDIRQMNASLNRLIRDKYPPEVVEASRKQAAKIKVKFSAEKAEQTSGSELAAFFTRDAEKALANLKTIISHAFRRADDFRQYVINVHSMKSALANIGETALSAIALKLELAGRAENTSVIISGTPAFLEALSEVIKKNRPKEDDEKDEAADYDKAYLGQKLADLQAACAVYDKTTIKAILAELKQKKWPGEVKELFNSISEYLLHSDFEEAAKLAKDFLQL
jgi:signal transduction histidine kinase/DNA-binding response OmpR family regulator